MMGARHTAIFTLRLAKALNAVKCTILAESVDALLDLYKEQKAEIERLQEENETLATTLGIKIIQKMAGAGND